MRGACVISDDETLAQLARERLRVSAPALTDAQWREWLAGVQARGGELVLTPDGARAVYPRRERVA